jgi:hypothetical protein
MLSAFAEETREIDDGMVCDIIGDLDFETQYWASGTSEPSENADKISMEVKSVELEDKLASFFHDITNRLDGIEKESVELRNMLRNEFEEKFNRLSFTFQNQTEETGAKVYELKRKIDDILEENRIIHILEDDQENKKGLLKRIFK